MAAYFRELAYMKDVFRLTQIVWAETELSRNTSIVQYKHVRRNSLVFVSSDWNWKILLLIFRLESTYRTKRHWNTRRQIVTSDASLSDCRLPLFYFSTVPLSCNDHKSCYSPWCLQPSDVLIWARFFRLFCSLFLKANTRRLTSLSFPQDLLSNHQISWTSALLVMIRWCCLNPVFLLFRLTVPGGTK